MTAKQENKLSMILTVAALCEREQAVWKDLPAFSNAVTRLRVSLSNIQRFAQAQSIATAGIAAEKLQRREVLAPVITRLAHSVHAYALNARDRELEAATRIAPSYLLQCRDSVVPIRAQGIIDTAIAHLADLADYGVTNPEIDLAQSKLNAYVERVSEPSGGPAVSAVKTEQLTDAFAEADEVLDGQLDSLILRFEETHPAVVAEYQHRRSIVDRPATQSRGEQTPTPTPTPTPPPIPTPLPAPTPVTVAAA